MGHLNKRLVSISWADGNVSTFRFLFEKDQFLMDKKFYWVMEDEQKRRRLITGHDEARKNNFFPFRKW